MRGAPRAGRRRRPLLGPAAIGAAVLVAALSASGGASRAPVAGGRARTAAATAYDWTRSTAAALALGGGPTSTLSAVVAPPAAGADWLIAGTRTAADGSTRATVWRSSNGVGWVATALAGADGQALAATAWGPRTVVVGSVGIGATQRAAVWIASGPGRPFALVPGSAAVLPTAQPGSPGLGTASMDVVAAGTQGVFATGVRSGRPAAWYSTDGRAWVDLTGATQVIEAATGAVVTSMLVTPSAVLAAGTVDAGSHTDGAVWTSPDGINWHREVPPGNPFSGPADHRINGLALTPSGAVLAVGGARSGPAWLPAAWISPDGNNWSQPSEALPAATRPQPVQGGAVVRAVTATGSALVAVGGSSTAQRLWVSPDGQSWTEAPLPAGAAEAEDWSADVVAQAGPTTVLVDTEPGQPHVLVRNRAAWREASAQTSIFGPVAPAATPAALLVEGSRLVLAVDVYRPGPAVGLSTRSVVVLSSSDGTLWHHLSDANALAGAWVDSMAVISGALVAVGTTSNSSGRPVAAVWTSPTGQRWHRAATFATGSRAPGAATTVAGRGPTVLAFGSAPNPAAGAKPGIDAVQTARVWAVPPLGATGPGEASTLDVTAGVGAETVLGSCSNGRTVVVVGTATRRGRPTDAGQVADGTAAVTWSSAPGTAWTAGVVSPPGDAGGDERVEGCAAVGTGFVAWGQAASPRGGAGPALWISPDGGTWVLQPTPSLDVAGAAPLTALAASGPDWVAVGGDQPAALATPWSPGSSIDDPDPRTASPSAASGSDGPAEIWSSSDAGRTWDRAATTGSAWAASGPLATDLVRLLGANLVVAGTVAGRLAAWVGVPAPSGSP
jgi:hypothetical protein